MRTSGHRLSTKIVDRKFIALVTALLLLGCSKFNLSPLSESANTASPSPGTTTSSSFGTYQKLFAADSPWNIYPVNPVLSATTIPTNVYSPSIDEGDYSTGIFEAKVTDGPMTVYPLVGNTDIANPDIGGTDLTITIPHWPSDVVGAAGTDGHADIVDETNGVVHSFWQLRLDGGVWRALMWTQTSLTGRGWGDPAHAHQGARAAGVPTSGGVIRQHEYLDGDTMYRHVLCMSLPAEALSPNPAYVFPATSADSDAAWVNTGTIPEGSLVMLPSTFDVSILNKDDMKKVARTLMTYGARVVDRNGQTPYVIYVENGTGWVGHGTSGWDNDYAADLEAVRAALRVVASQDGFKDLDGNAVALTPHDSGYELLSLRGPWNLITGSVMGEFDSLTQSLIWGPTGSTASFQANTNGTGAGLVSWAAFIPGMTYHFRVHATGGATLRLELHDSSYVTVYNSGDLSDGQSVTFTWPADGWVVPVATSGTNVSSSSVRGSLTMY